MAQRIIQSSFTFGELDPKLFARSDFGGYYKGAAKMRNAVVVPQGSVTKRFGSQIIAKMEDVTAGADITDTTNIKVVAMKRANAGIYFIVHRIDNTTDTAFSIYDEDFVLQATVAGSSNWTVAQLAELRYTVTQDRILIWHKDVNPYQLFNSDPTDATDWVLSAITFTQKPTYDFSTEDGISYQSYYFNFSSPNQILCTDGAATDIAYFHSNHIGGYVIGNGGILRITAVPAAATLGSVAEGYVVQDFLSTSQSIGELWLITEPAWSDANATAPAAVGRGWPSFAKEIQGRLVAGNTGLLPHVCWLSKLYNYLNFDDSETNADNSFSIALDAGDELQSIEDKNAAIFIGKRGTYSTGQTANEPLTPANAGIFREDSRGGKRLDAQIHDDLVFYADSQGYQINGMASELTGVGSTNFDVFNATILSSQIVADPVSICQYRSTTNNGKYLLAVNADGTMLMYTSERKQEVSAWSLAETRGSYGPLACLDDVTIGFVKRSINSGATIASDADYVFKTNSDQDVWIDITADSADAASDVELFSAEDDYLYIGNDAPFDGIAVALNTLSSDNITPVFEYFHIDEVWTAFTPTDGTTGFTAAGNITWVSETTTSDWIPTEVNEIKNKFWIRIQRTATTVTTPPIEDTIKINSQDVILLEKLTFQATMDAAITTTSNGSGLVTGLDNLIGQSVFVNADGLVEGPYIVDGSGEITITATNATSVEVGLFFSPLIIPMPAVVADPTNPSGADLYKPRLIKTFFIDYFESLGIYVNNVPAPDVSLGSYVIGQDVRLQTRVHEIKPRTGWDPRIEIEIKQKAPLPFTLRGIGYIVEVS